MRTQQGRYFKMAGQQLQRHAGTTRHDNHICKLCEKGHLYVDGHEAFHGSRTC